MAIFEGFCFHKPHHHSFNMCDCTHKLSLLVCMSREIIFHFPFLRTLLHYLLLINNEEQGEMCPRGNQNHGIFVSKLFLSWRLLFSVVKNSLDFYYISILYFFQLFAIFIYPTPSRNSIAKCKTKEIYTVSFLLLSASFHHISSSCFFLSVFNYLRLLSLNFKPPILKLLTF